VTRPVTLAPPAEHPIVAAAIAYCRAVGIKVAASGPALMPTGGRTGRFTLLTERGPVTFFWRRQFARSTIFMRSEFTAWGWPEPGRLYLADAIEVPVDGRTALLIPPVINELSLAPGMCQSTDTADPAQRDLLCELAAAAVSRFQQVRPSRISAAAEVADLAVHHASTRALTEWMHERIRAAVTPWARVIDGFPAGMYPRDFYRNLLVGVPLGIPAGRGALTLIDYGESQKQCCISDAFAALAVHAAVVSAEPATTCAWLAGLANRLINNSAQSAAFPLFLALWQLREALRHADARVASTAIERVERASPDLAVPTALTALCRSPWR
jgi:hypothetical protein